MVKGQQKKLLEENQEEGRRKRRYRSRWIDDVEST